MYGEAISPSSILPIGNWEKGKLTEIGPGVHESPKNHRCSPEFGWLHRSLGKLCVGQAMEEQHRI
jgi:hypothetical protein